MTDQTQVPVGINKWEICIAAVFFVIGAYMVYQGVQYGLGSIVRIGPGFFPMCIGVMLMGLAVGVGLEVRHSLAKPPSISLRVVAAIASGLLGFALLVNSAGLVPAIFAVVFISRFAESGNSLRTSFLLAAGLAVVSWLVFIVGLKMPLKALWW